MISDPEFQLDKIIAQKQIKTVFQPIISLRDGSVLGHEALSRITGTSEITNPEELFQLAGTYNRLWDLELLCRTTALETAYLCMKPPYDKKLFLNVNPNVMHDVKFKQGFTKEYLSKYGITPEKIIFEITERNAIYDMNGFKGTISHYKNQNYQIAIDDAGAGYSGLNLISDINPHFIKLDLNLIRDIDTDSMKFALVKSMIELSRMANIFLIAEGVETKEELSTLINLGVQYGQGYYFQKPSETVTEINPDVIDTLIEMNRKRNHVVGNQTSNVYIENLCTCGETILPSTKVEVVFDKLKRDPLSIGYCVVENGIVLGIVSKEKLTLQMSGRFGFSLNQNRAISYLMDQNFLEVDYQTPINMVSSIAMARPNEKLYDFIVVTKNGKYIGTVTIKDLLQKTTEIEVDNAKYQNPLSGLPGNLTINQKISHCITGEMPYSIIYIDIDNFKAYNDVYGFENGDMIIKLLANIITVHTPENQFVGHVGGDDFVVILEGFQTNDLCDKIIHDFEESALQYYNRQDIENGYIIAENRHGVVEKFPLLSLSIAGISNNKKRFANMYELTEELAKMKKKSKQQAGSYCCWYN
ncbi:MAG TPA: GGDEF domain-containing protein [Oscillospiraceae bacterium]|nr:GGDEF domain-containing protein [Oscillospiraceae bacterium]